MNLAEYKSKSLLKAALPGKKITVVGGGKSGIAAARLAKKAGLLPFVSEYKELEPKFKDQLQKDNIPFEENGHTERVMDSNLVIISPGVPGNMPIVEKCRDKQIPIVSEIEFAWWFDPGQVVAITGSQGKTTTTTLIGKLLDEAGFPTFVGGNIGFPYSNYVATASKENWSVLEVSSFQLEHVVHFAPRIIVLTNITPNHLDRYKNFGEYIAAKLNILQHADKNTLIIYNYDDSILREHFNKSRIESKIMTFSLSEQEKSAAFIKQNALFVNLSKGPQKVMELSEIKLMGKHNLLNIMAASLVGVALNITRSAFINVFTTFKGIEHRLELVETVDGVEYYNDSKCTTVDALRFSMDSFLKPVILIVGGKDKGGSFVELRDLAERKLKKAILIGQAAARIQSEWGGAVSMEKADSLREALDKARREATQGDVVLLSPACSSFDMFKNFEDRGNQFKEIVKSLKEEA